MALTTQQVLEALKPAGLSGDDFDLTPEPEMGGVYVRPRVKGRGDLDKALMALMSGLEGHMVLPSRSPDDPHLYVR